MTPPKAKTPVLIAVPLRRFDPEDPAKYLPEHLQKMLSILVSSPDLPWSFEMMTFGGGNVARGRNKIVASFLRGPWRWLTFIDDDIEAEDSDPQVMAQNVVDILSRRKMVCGGLYTTKQDNANWVCNTFQEAETDPEGLLRVGEIGTGGAKTYARIVFETLLSKEPNLAYVCDETLAPEWGFFCQGLMTVDGKRRWLPEDFWLDQICRKHGIPVYADTKIKFRHRDVANDVTYPLNDEWPRMPGPVVPIPLPPTIDEDSPVPAGAMKLVIALQYWAGDRLAAQRLAKFIADIEPVRREDVELCIVRRHDAEAMDTEVMYHLTEKFAVSLRVTPEHVVGYPASPNFMAYDVMQAAADWEDVNAVLLMEADCVPVARDWIDQLKAEWLRAAEQGKLLLGSWRAACHANGHINGNMLFGPSLVRKAGVKPCPVKKPWDVYYVKYFEPHWMRTGLISNRYCELYVDDDKMRTPECGTRPPCLIHGVKDQSTWNYARKKLGMPNA